VVEKDDLAFYRAWQMMALVIDHFALPALKKPI